MVIIINMYPVSEKCFSGALNNPGWTLTTHGIL
jgi:hypothetical protein